MLSLLTLLSHSLSTYDIQVPTYLFFSFFFDIPHFGARCARVVLNSLDLH